MSLFPEREKTNNVLERPDAPSALNIERKEVVTPVATTFKAQVTDDKGNPLIKTPQETKIKIEIPFSDKESLTKIAKTTIDETPAWSARFWLRMLAKAVIRSWEVIFR